MGVLRVLLALFVVIDHSRALSTFHLPGGVFAVKVFFIISGFYMTLILNKKYIGKGSYGLFISNRFLRLYPIYWVVVGLTIFASFTFFLIFNNWMRLMPYVAYNEFMSIKTIIFLIFTNFFLFFQDIVMFLGINLDSGSMFFTNNFNMTNPELHNFLLIPQAWTIGLELIFYLVAPFLVRKRLRIIIFLISVSFILRGYIYFVLGLHHDPWTYRFFPTELALFFFGTISYHLYLYIQNNPIKMIYHKVIIFLYFTILIFYKYLPNLELSVDINSVLFYTLTALIIPSLFILTKSSKIDSRIGDLSYPIYIVHMLIIYITSIIIDKFSLNIHKGTIVVIFTIIISYLLVKYVADPVEKIRQKRVKISK